MVFALGGAAADDAAETWRTAEAYMACGRDYVNTASQPTLEAEVACATKLDAYAAAMRNLVRNAMAKEGKSAEQAQAFAAQRGGGAHEAGLSFGHSVRFGGDRRRHPCDRRRLLSAVINGRGSRRCGARPGNGDRSSARTAAPRNRNVEQRWPPTLYGGMHYRDNMLDFNPADLPEDWQESLLPKLFPGARMWISTSDDVVEATVERAELRLGAADPRDPSKSTFRVRVAPSKPLPEEIVFVGLSPLRRPSWTTRGTTDEERAFAKAHAKAQFKAITGMAYEGPLTYTDRRWGRQTIDLDKLGFGAFVVETQKGVFLVTTFQLPGDYVGHTTAFHKESGGPWRQILSLTDDFRARIPRIDVDGDGIPELLHSGPAGGAWELEAFYPELKTVMRISP